MSIGFDGLLHPLILTTPNSTFNTSIAHNTHFHSPLLPPPAHPSSIAPAPVSVSLVMSSQRVSVLVLALVAAYVGMPLNGFSPSFTQVASDMGYSNPQQRDIYFASYLSLSMMIGQILGSLLGGYLADVYNRKTIILYSLMLDAIAMILFSLPLYISSFLFLRLITGFCQGIMIPLLFSMIGDLFTHQQRVFTSAIISSCLGGGILIGQILFGFLFAYTNWYMPFVITGISGSLLIASFRIFIEEPPRGGNISNNDTDDKVLQNGFDYFQLYRSICIPTAMLVLCQSIPGTIPWGILSTHLQDMLTQDFHISMSQATSFIAVFGFGGAIGGIVSGVLGGVLYSSHRQLFPVFLGTTCAGASILLQHLLDSDLKASSWVLFLLMVSGGLAAVSGTNVRTVLINVSSPQYRGSLIGLMNVLGCIGRGVGPSLTAMYMVVYKVGRVEAIRVCLYIWMLSGGILCLAGATVARDEDRLKAGDKKFTLMNTEDFA